LMATKVPWGERGHKNGFGLEVAVSMISDLYGGVFSGASAITTALIGLEGCPDELMRLRTELTACSAGSVDTVSLDNLYRSPQLMRVMCEALRYRHPVPLLKRVVVKPDVVIDNTALPVGTDITITTRSDMYNPMWGDDPEIYRPSRWTNELLNNVASKWEVGVAGFIPFGNGPRRCNGRMLAFPSMLCIVARFVMDCQFFFDKKTETPYENETYFYGTAGYKGVELSLLNADHPEIAEQKGWTLATLSEQGVGCGMYAGAMSLLINLKARFDIKSAMLDVKPAEQDYFTFGPPPLDVIKLGNTLLQINKPYTDGGVVEDIADALFDTLNGTSMQEDVGPSFETPQDEVEWLKGAYPDIVSSAQLTGGSSYWPGGVSDIGTSRVFTHGLGSSFLMHCGDHLEVDLTVLNQFKMRPGLEPQGCLARFSLSGDLTSISKQGKTFVPGDGEGWNKAKMSLRSTAIIFLTLRDHLTWVHLVVANGTLRCQRQTLPSSHPISRLLQPFLFNTCGINQGAVKTLLPNGSLAHRLSGLAEADYDDAFSFAFESWVFETFPDSVKRRGMDKVPGEVYPFAQEGTALWDAIAAFCEEFVGIYYADDQALQQDDPARNFMSAMNECMKVPVATKAAPATCQHLVLLLTMHVFWVTGYHNFAGGQLALVLQTPFMFPPVMLEWDKTDMKTPWTALLPPQKMIMTEWTLVAMTQGTNPMLCDDFSHLFAGLPQQERVTRLIQDFTGPRLQAVGDELEARNAHRQWPLRMFHPRLLLSSVSV